MKHTLIPIANHGITLAELPGRVALFLEIGLCEVRCKGCHSPHLTCRTCDLFTDSQVELLINNYLKNVPDIDAVVFMGGLHNSYVDLEAFELLIGRIKVPCGIYSGQEENLDIMLKWDNLKWLKVGKYDERLGGLENPRTNQRFFTKYPEYHFDVYGVYDYTSQYWQDNTHLFARKEDIVVKQIKPSTD